MGDHIFWHYLASHWTTESRFFLLFPTLDWVPDFHFFADFPRETSPTPPSPAANNFSIHHLLMQLPSLQSLPELLSKKNPAWFVNFASLLNKSWVYWRGTSLNLAVPSFPNHCPNFFRASGTAFTDVPPQLLPQKISEWHFSTFSMCFRAVVSRDWTVAGSRAVGESRAIRSEARKRALLCWIAIGFLTARGIIR
jgi:hypothetical protein